MERIVIVGLRPFAGQEKALREMVKKHWSILKAENLVSDRRPIIMEAKDGSFIEVFGWKSQEAIDAAHSNPTVQQMWEDYAKVCEYLPVGNIEETQHLFSEFSPV